MRFAAIADIHGNALALEAVLADITAQGIAPRDIVNLGDSLSGPLEAGRTADLLLKADLVTVRGNHDRYLIEYAADKMHSWEADAFAQLRPDHIAWLKTLPHDLVWLDDIYLCHATPQDDNTYWLESVTVEGYVVARPIVEVEAWAAGIAQSLILCGHTHLARTTRLTDGQLIVNPGSVGCPAYDDTTPHFHKVEAGHVAACYAILEKKGREWSVTHRQVPYDHGAMAALAAKNGRADWASGLAVGHLGQVG